MSLQFDCPLPAAIPSIGNLACAEHFGQVVKVGFQRTGYNFADITDEAEWDVVLAAAGATKVQFSPFTEGLTFPSGDPIVEGPDDNSTLFGQTIVLGGPSVVAAGFHRGLSSAICTELQEYMGESSVFGNLGVYLINEHNQVISAGVTVFDIQSYFIGDATSEGFNTHNKTNFQWSFAYGWSKNFTISAPLSWSIINKQNP